MLEMSIVVTDEKSLIVRYGDKGLYRTKNIDKTMMFIDVIDSVDDGVEKETDWSSMAVSGILDSMSYKIGINTSDNYRRLFDRIRDRIR